MPGRVRGTVAVAIGLVIGLSLAACGDDDDGRALSRAEFMNQGNAICARHIAAIENGAKASFVDRDGITPDQAEAFARGTFTREVEAMRDELDRLEPPDNDRDDVDDYLSELGRALDDEVGHFPVALISEEESQNPLVKADDLAEDAGLSECAKLSDRLRAATRPQTARK